MAELAFLAVDGTNLNDAPETPLAHVVDDVAGQVEGARKIGIDHGAPVFLVHLVQRFVASDTGVVNQDGDATDVCLDVGNVFLTSVEIPDIEFVDGDPGFVFEGVGVVVIAAVISDHRWAGFLQGQ